MSTFLGNARAVLLGGASGPLEGKALQAPDYSQRTSVDLFGPTVTRRLSQGGASKYLQAYAGTESVDWVHDAVGVYLSAASSAEFHFERDGKRMRTPDTPKEAGEYPGGEVPTALWNLVNRPNPFQDWTDLLEHLVIDLLLVGNHYWLKYGDDGSGRPLALYRLTPAWIEVIPGSDRLVEKYLYHVEGQAQPLQFTPDELIHFKLPNPHSPYYGAGVISGSPRVYDVELALVDTMANFFERGTKLSGVLSSERSMPDPLVDKIRRRFASMYSGRGNAYQVAVLERGLTFQPIQPTAAEAEFVELTKLGRDRVFDMFGVHPSLVSGDAARPGLLEEAQRFFDNKKMKPFLRKVGRAVSAELTSQWGVDLVFDYEYVMPEKDRLTLAAVFSALPGVTVKEVREYVKLPPLGDNRDEILLNMPGIGVDAGGSPAGAMPGPDGGRPANPNNMGGVNGPGTRPDARYARAKGKLQKAMASGDPEALDEALEEFRGLSAGMSDTTNGDAEHLAAPDVKAMGERVVQVLLRNRSLKKTQRELILQDVEQATANWPKDASKLRGRVIARVAEGIRRGHSIDQILDGAEGLVGVRQLMEAEHGAA